MDEDAARAAWWAALLGRHALSAFALGLLGVLAATAVAFLGLRRITVRPQHSRWPPQLFFGLRMGVGFLAVLGAGALFAEMLEAFDAEEEIGVFDERLAAALSASLPAAALRLFSVATHLGDPITLAVVVAVVALLLWWRGRRWLALAWVSAGVGNGLLNPMLKQIFERARPEHSHGFIVAEGFSFPSGHTSGAVVIYGMLAYLAVRLLPPRWHLGCVLAAAALAYSTACSRVLLQVHWASDVVAGAASGLAWLLVCLLSVEALGHYRRRA